MSNWVDGEQLTIQPLKHADGSWTWVTSRDFSFFLGGIANEPAVITIPEGFETDLGSIPRWLRWLFNPSDPECTRSYVLHDWINYMTGGQPPGFGVWSSILACAALYDGLRCDGCKVLKATAIVVGVFIGIAKGER